MRSTPQHVRSVSARDAAARCGVSERTVRRWIASGQLQADKRGQRFRIPLESLEPYVRIDSGRAADNRGEADTSATSNTEDSTLEADTPRQVSEALHLAALLRETQAALVQKSEAAAMWQARAEMLATELGRMKALAPSLEEVAASAPQSRSESPAVPVRRSWWQFWRSA